MPIVVSEDGLTPKQRLFVAAYLANNWNGTDAARKAGYKGNEKQLGIVASQNLGKIRIKALVEQKLRAMMLSDEQILARYAEMAKCDPSKFFDKDGKFNWAEFHRKGYLVKKFKCGGKRGSPPELELHDAQSALAMLGKHRGLFTDKVEVGGVGGGPVEHKFEVVVTERKSES